MRSLSRALLLMLAFVIPWQYSADLGPPFGNVARVLALMLLFIALLAAVRAGTLRSLGPVQWISLGLFLWLCCTVFWALDPAVSLRQVRGYAQELVIVWLVWEFIDTSRDLRRLMGAYVCGAAVLSALTLGIFLFSSSPGQVRFVAQGQDPNDAARIIALALPLAALLLKTERDVRLRLFFAACLPLGVFAVLLTASRSGFVALVAALAGSAILLLFGSRPAVVTIATFGVPASAAALWIALPPQTAMRLLSLPSELHAGDLNQRLDIWLAGWQAFIRAPLFGSGAGSYVLAARLAPPDTAHNTALALAVEGGVVAVAIALALVVAVVVLILRTRGPLRLALLALLVVGLLGSLVATVHENRVTWLLLGIFSAAARLAIHEQSALGAEFSPLRELNGVSVPLAPAGAQD